MFDLRDNYNLPTAGGSCYLCKATKRQHERVVGTQAYIDGEGYIDLCESCVGNMARLLGWLSPDEFEQLAAERDSLRDDIDKAKADSATVAKIKELV